LSKRSAMHTIKIKVGDSIYDHILFLLKSLKHEDLKIVEENKQNVVTKQKIKELLSNNKIELFTDIKDPLEWQRKQREEW